MDDEQEVVQKYVTIEFCGKKIHIFNCDGPIIKGLQFKTNM